jgi:ATP-dependent Zn protease
VTSLLQVNQGRLKALADELVKKETLDAAEIKKLIGLGN